MGRGRGKPRGLGQRGLRRRSADVRGPALQLAAHHQPRDLFLQIGDPSFEIALLPHRRAQAVQNLGRAPEFVPQDEDGVNLGDCHQGQHEGLRDVDEVGGAHVAQGPTQPIQPDWCGEIWGKAKRRQIGFLACGRQVVASACRRAFYSASARASATFLTLTSATFLDGPSARPASRLTEIGEQSRRAGRAKEESVREIEECAVFEKCASQVAAYARAETRAGFGHRRVNETISRDYRAAVAEGATDLLSLSCCEN
jgi:hypothetical protein